MKIKCIKTQLIENIETHKMIKWENGLVYEVSKRLGTWLLGCYMKVFALAPDDAEVSAERSEGVTKPKPKAKAQKPKTQKKAKK